MINEDTVKEIEKGKLKRENVGMPLAVFIERNNLQYNTDFADFKVAQASSL